MAKKFDLSVIFRITDKATAPVKKIGRSIGALTKPVKKATRSFDRLGKSLKKMSKDMKKIGKDLALKLTAPITLGAGLIAKASIDFESAWTGVLKTVTASKTELTTLKTELMDMALTIPLTTTELFNIAESAGQLGIKTKDISAFTKVMADLGATTNLTTEEAASSLAKLANITGLSSKEYENLGSTIVDLGNNMATTERDIVAMGMRLAGAGNTVGLSEANILSLAAALSSVGVEAEAGGTAFSQTMKKIDKEIGTGSKKMKGFAFVSGKSVKDFEKAWKEDAGGTLISFTEGLARMQKEGKNINIILDKLGFEGIRVSDSLLRASGAGDKFREALKLGDKAWEENIALAKEANLRYKTSAARLQMAKNRVMQLAASFGDILVPVILKVVELFEPLVKWLRELDPRFKKVILVLGTVLALIGPVLIGIGILSAALAAIATPVLAGIAAVAAAIVGLAGLAVIIIEAWEPVKTFFKDLWDFIKLGAVDVAKKLTSIIPDWLKFDIGFTKNRKGSIENSQISNPSSGLISSHSSKSETDINIKVTSDQGSTAQIERVKRKSGDSNVNIATAGYVGAGL